jgi:FkbM family methyltransferase
MLTNDFWSALTREKRNILVYGMGNGADKLLAEAEKRGVSVSGIFASDGFVRGHSFHGMRVLSYSEVRATYPRESTVILLAFGSARPEVLELIERVAGEYPLYVPDLPVCGTQLFDEAFAAAHREELLSARALFSDEASRLLFDRIVAARLSARFEELMLAVSERSAFDYLTRFSRPVAGVADFGAYNGDSAREVMARFPVRFLLAAEPDRRNFRKLSTWSESVTDTVIECHNVAVFDRVGEASFDASGNRNAGLCTGRESVLVATASPDSLLAGRAVDYMKFDIEGAEREGLLGSAETIAVHRPALRVALYHRPEDLFSLPLLCHSLASDYDFYLTRERSLPLWDIDLVAIPH